VADALSAAADAAPTVTLTAARTVAAEHLAATGAVTPLSLERFVALWSRFDGFALKSHGATLVADVDVTVVTAFVQARTSRGHRPSPATSHLRRTALRLLFRVLRSLRLAKTDPTLDLALPSRTSTRARPLTDEEVELCRWASLGTVVATRLPAVWALAESGAAAVEIGSVGIADLDLAAGAVWLGGSPKTRARRAPLTEWGAVQLRRRVRDLGPSDASQPVVYDGHGSPHSQRTTSAEGVRSVLERAGLTGDPDVRPRSVTAWVGRRVLAETGQIDAVARRLGLRSLDLAADLIDFDWCGERDTGP
jgi:integrase/recombinase XerC